MVDYGGVIVMVRGRTFRQTSIGSPKVTLEMADVTTDVLLESGHTMVQHDQLTGIHKSLVVRIIDDRKARIRSATYLTCYTKRYCGQQTRVIIKRARKEEPLCWNYLLAPLPWAQRREILDLTTLLLTSANDPRNASLLGIQMALS